MTLALADAIPIWSLIMKAVQPSIEGPVQYFGGWFLLCFILQASFAYSLCQRIYRTWWERSMITIIITFSPILIYRIAHPALCAHWLILAAFKIFIDFDRTSRIKTTGKSALLLSLATGIHPYFIPMVGLILALIPFQWALSNRRWNLPFLSLHTLSLALVVFVSLEALGLRSHYRPVRLGVHFWTADVLSFLQPQGTSRWFPDLWASRFGQYEGYGYLGLGGIMLAFLLLGARALPPRPRWGNWLRHRSYGFLVLACILLWVWSWGEQVRIFGRWVLQLHSLYAPFYDAIGAFRSAGRFLWPIYYLILLSSWRLLGHMRPQWSRPHILVGIMILQLIDSSKQWRWKGLQVAAPSLLNAAEWRQRIPAHLTDIALVPPHLPNTSCVREGWQADDYIPFAFLAFELGMHFNSGNRPNPPEELSAGYCREFMGKLKLGQWDDQTFYLIDNELIAQFDVNQLSCESHDQYWACFKPPSSP
jgi:hypothetical protein